MSQRRLLLYSLAPAALVAALVGWLSLGLAPQGIAEVDRILNQQDSLTEFDTLVPGRFQNLRDGSRVTYTRELSADRSELAGVFISETNTSARSGKARGVSVLVAESGRQEIQPDGSRYLILENGFRYDGNPGQADYRAIQYDTYGVLLPKPQVAVELSEREAMPTRELLGSDNLRHRSELQWRLSMPVLVFVVTLLAVPLARVNPRQGRFLKLLPAILLLHDISGAAHRCARRARQGADSDGTRLVVGARAVFRDRSADVVLGAVDAEVEEASHGAGGGAWLSSIDTSRSMSFWRF